MASFLDYNYFYYEPLKAYSLGIFSQKEAIQQFKKRVYRRVRYLIDVIIRLPGALDLIQASTRSDEVSQLIHNEQVLCEQLESLYIDRPEYKKKQKEQHTNEISNGQKRRRRLIGKIPNADEMTNGLFSIYAYYESVVGKTLEIINLSDIIIEKLENSTNLNDFTRVDEIKSVLNDIWKYCHKYNTTNKEKYTVDLNLDNNKRGELKPFLLSDILYIEHKERLKRNYESQRFAQCAQDNHDEYSFDDEDYIYYENYFIESSVIRPYLLMLLKVAIAYDDFEKTSILLSSIYDTLSKLNPNLFESKADFVPAAHDLIQSFKDCPIHFTKAFFYCLSRYGLISSESYEKTIFALNQGDELILVTALNRETEAKKLINKCSSLFKLVSKLNQCETIDRELSECADCVLKSLSPIKPSEDYRHEGNWQYAGMVAINEEIKKLDLFDSSELVVFMDVATANGIYELKYRGAQKLLSHIKLISVEPNKKALLVETGLDKRSMNAQELKDSIESGPDFSHMRSFKPYPNFNMSQLYSFLLNEGVIIGIDEELFSDCITHAHINELWAIAGPRRKRNLLQCVFKMLSQEYFTDDWINTCASNLDKKRKQITNPTTTNNQKILNFEDRLRAILKGKKSD